MLILIELKILELVLVEEAKLVLRLRLLTKSKKIQRLYCLAFYNALGLQVNSLLILPIFEFNANTWKLF